MSGHSKWSQIKRQKGVNDARRGQLFTKLGREIIVAAREGGPDPDANFRLRMAMQKAREANMPVDNIDRAIKRASERTEGANLEEISYEGYGPGGAAIIVQGMTDNRNRTAADIRNTFSRNGGNIGEVGSVGWMFDNRGVVVVNLNGKDEEEATLTAIDVGAVDVEPEDGTLIVYTEPTSFVQVRNALDSGGLAVREAELKLIPKTTVSLEERNAHQLMRLVEKLEDLDDVQVVYTNAEFPDEFAESYEG